MPDETQETNDTEEKTLADYGLEAYYLVLLLRGDGGPTEYDELVKLQEGHLANIRRLHEAGYMKVAGPFGPNTPEEMRGVFILKADSQQHAEELLSSDPSIQAGRLKAQVLEWFVPAGTF